MSGYFAFFINNASKKDNEMLFFAALRPSIGEQKAEFMRLRMPRLR